MVDAVNFLTENFDFIKNNSIEGCPSLLVWLPERSHIRKTYGNMMDCPWKLLLGRRSTWNRLEVVLRHSEGFESAVFSPNLCETRTVVIDNGISMNLKITMYNVVFQKVEKNNFFSRRKFQLLL